MLIELKTSLLSEQKNMLVKYICILGSKINLTDSMTTPAETTPDTISWYELTLNYKLIGKILKVLDHISVDPIKYNNLINCVS